MGAEEEIVQFNIHFSGYFKWARERLSKLEEIKMKSIFSSSSFNQQQTNKNHLISQEDGKEKLSSHLFGTQWI